MYEKIKFLLTKRRRLGYNEGHAFLRGEGVIELSTAAKVNTFAVEYAPDTDSGSSILINGGVMLCSVPISPRSVSVPRCTVSVREWLPATVARFSLVAALRAALA
jgi:hypothetical protein